MARSSQFVSSLAGVGSFVLPVGGVTTSFFLDLCYVGKKICSTTFVQEIMLLCEEHVLFEKIVDDGDNAD